MTLSSDKPLIIEAALNGGTPKAANAHVPTSSDELVRDGLACLEAGASVVHTHAPDPTLRAREAAAKYLEHFEPILARYPEALVYPTIVFHDPIEERVGHLPLLRERCGLRIGLMEPGSGSYVGTDEDGLPLDTERVYTNSPREIRYMADQCERLGLGPSMVIFDPGFLRHALVYWSQGRMPRGVFMRLTLCGGRSYRGGQHIDLLCGMPAEPWALDTYLRMLGDAPIPWAVSVVSGDVFENGVARYALEQGGHLRVGLEDYAGPERPTNVELVGRAVALAKRVGRPVADSSQAARILDLPPT
ncbi:MAG: 3-keto-5-aminohexanoate cleavage protein [Deltaproteobacteria bacterium]|nr:3-keto-5-aminohexanoate cleavage protein [Deltaproteobacteria bacterium]